MPIRFPWLPTMFTVVLLCDCLSVNAQSGTLAPPATEDGVQQATPNGEIAPLSDDEIQAMSTINERIVKGTVSFLASDELGGRGTPSPGFTIACGYVASRFRAAGLQAGGTDGSFYQKHNIDLVQLPSKGVTLEFDGGRQLPNLGLIAATNVQVDFSGPVTSIQNWDTWSNAPGGQTGVTGAVLVPADGNVPAGRQLRQWQRRAEQLKKSGAEVILLAVDPSSDFIALSLQLSESPAMSRDDSSWPVPVILVDKATVLTGPVQVHVPAVTRTTESISNVVGILPGSDPELAKEAIIFSAHLDHLGVRDNGMPDQIYNGADDDASGVTGVLSLADAFGSLQDRPARTLIFATFWGEELGLVGSRRMAETPVWPLAETLAMINIEMIGRPEAGANGKIWMTGWEHSTLGTTLAVGAKRVEVEVFDHPKYSAMLYGSSDNKPFVDAGVIAHSFSAGSLHDDYHQPADHWEKLETRHMTLVIQGLFAGSLPIARGTLTPAKTSVNRK